MLLVWGGQWYSIHSVAGMHADAVGVCYWFGEDRVGGDSKSGDHMLLHKGQSSREVLSEPSQVHLRLLVVQLQQTKRGIINTKVFIVSSKEGFHVVHNFKIVT